MPFEGQEQRTAWQVAPLADLIRHLVGSRHQECRVDMSGLETLLALSAMEPGPAHLALVEIRNLINLFCAELRAHLAREEADLFPVLLAMELGFASGTGNEHLGLMRSLLEEEHVRELGLLRDIQAFTEALATDQPADSPQGRLHEALTGFSTRFQDHLRLENQVLFPRMG